MSPRRWTLALALLAVLARAGLILALQSHTVPRSTYEHGEIAANLVAGRGFAIQFLGAQGPTSQQAPLYPALLAVAYSLAGVETPAALLLMQMAQALLGGLLVLAVAQLAREALPRSPRAPLLAALVVALHPTLVYAATHIQVALLATTLLSATLALVYRLRRTRDLRDALAAGLALGLLLLTDPILGLVLPPVALLLLVDPTHPLTARLRTQAVLLLVAALVVAPWIVRNLQVHREFVFVKSTFGYAFWQGNCSVSQGTDKVLRPAVANALKPTDRSLASLNRALWSARHVAGYIDDIALTRADKQALGQLSEPERSRVLFRRALADLRAQPLRYPTLCLRRLRYFLLFDETNPKTQNTVYRAAHLALSAWAALGLILMGPASRRRLTPTFLVALLVTIFHSLTIVSARFHLPLEPILALWGAAGFAAGRIPASSRPTLPAPHAARHPQAHHVS